MDAELFLLQLNMLSVFINLIVLTFQDEEI
jgi:hypothetical protein